MNLGVIFAIFGALLALAIALPGLLLAWALLLPAQVERARLRIERTPWRCLGLGLAATLLALLPVGGLLAMPGLLQLAGWVGLSMLLATASLGGAGLAAVMGHRLSKGPVSTLTPAALLRSAVALELAAIVPLVGWFVLLPLLSLLSVGAAILAVLRPAPARRPAPAVMEVAHGAQPS